MGGHRATLHLLLASALYNIRLVSGSWWCSELAGYPKVSLHFCRLEAAQPVTHPKCHQKIVVANLWSFALSLLVPVA